MLESRKNLIIKVISNYPNMSNKAVSRYIINNYSDYQYISLETLRKQVAKIRKYDIECDMNTDELMLKNNDDVTTNVAKIKDTDIEIDKNDWLKSGQNIRKFKNIVKQQENVIKTLTNEYDDQYRLIEELRNKIPILPIIKEIPKIRFDKNKVDEDVVMMLSDIHAGEVVDKYEMEGYGEYNFDIMCQRLYFLCEKTIEIVENQRNISNIKKLWIDCLGDFVHGELHQAEYNESTIVLIVLNLSTVIAQFIAMLSRHFPEIEVTCVVGNHGRFERKPPTKGIYNNWDYLVYQNAALVLKNYKNVKFNISKSPNCIINRADKSFLLTHGDSVRGGFAGIPVYGMYRVFSNEQDIRSHDGGIDYLEMGHFHQSLNLKDGRLIVNGSVVGNSQYNLHKLHTVSDPSQKIFGINKKYGISWERNMKLNNVPKNHKFIYKFEDSVVYAELFNE